MYLFGGLGEVDEIDFAFTVADISGLEIIMVDTRFFFNFFDEAVDFISVFEEASDTHLFAAVAHFNSFSFFFDFNNFGDEVI
jgi:hypothetical protein